MTSRKVVAVRQYTLLHQLTRLTRDAHRPPSAPQIPQAFSLEAQSSTSNRSFVILPVTHLQPFHIIESPYQTTTRQRKAITECLLSPTVTVARPLFNRAQTYIMSEDRLWKFRKPEWMHSAWARNAGVYAAGGLVCLFFSPPPPVAAFRHSNSTVCVKPVLPSLLHPPRRRRLVQARQPLGRARHVYRLAAPALFVPGHAHHQFRREAEVVRRLLLVLWVWSGVEGPGRAIPGIRELGGRNGGWCYRVCDEVCRR